MHFPDLSNECQIAHGPKVRAIGWLEKGHPFTTGEPPDDFGPALTAHLGSGRWLPITSAGIHPCDWCSGAAGAQNLVVPSVDCVYVAPELILHYVRDHRYLPPAEFIAAVRALPPLGSDAYFRAFLPFLDVWGFHAATHAQIVSSCLAAAIPPPLESEPRKKFEW